MKEAISKKYFCADFRLSGIQISSYKIDCGKITPVFFMK
jgi:hypothetical protein